MPTQTNIFTDDFNRANTSVAGANTTTAVGNNWKDKAGSNGHIVSNKMQMESSDFQHARMA